ncbi:hypothetical protein CPB85DRAFT_718570 [Mucidula mucida]|nr:hypothetical protein CPB85DRAFT_718570 [Mucidula mucida]
MLDFACCFTLLLTNGLYQPPLHSSTGHLRGRFPACLFTLFLFTAALVLCSCSSLLFPNNTPVLPAYCYPPTTCVCCCAARRFIKGNNTSNLICDAIRNRLRTQRLPPSHLEGFPLSGFQTNPCPGAPFWCSYARPPSIRSSDHFPHAPLWTFHSMMHSAPHVRPVTDSTSKMELLTPILGLACLLGSPHLDNPAS